MKNGNTNCVPRLELPHRKVIVHIILLARGSGLRANHLPVVPLLNSGSCVTVLINSRIAQTQLSTTPSYYCLYFTIGISTYSYTMFVS